MERSLLRRASYRQESNWSATASGVVFLYAEQWASTPKDGRSPDMMGYQRGLLSAVTESAQLVWLALTPRNDARRIYGLLGEHSCIGEDSRFMNLGYWADSSVQTLDAASRALSILLAETA